MTDIYFIRHGQASFGSKNYDQLSELGFRQANILAEYFIDMEAYFPVVYSGTKKRQIDTARPIVARLVENDVGTKLKILPGLNEFDISGLLKHCSEDMIRSDETFEEDLKQSNKDYLAFQRIFVKVLQWSLRETNDDLQVENFSRFKNRVHDTIEAIVTESRQYKKVAVVTSGGVLALVMQMAFNLSDAKAIDLVWYFYNASVTVFNTERNRLELKIKNSIVHFSKPEHHELLTNV